MCEFLSGIVTRQGEIHFCLVSDSHEHLIDFLGIKDGDKQNITRFEFTPENKKDYDKPQKYLLKIDEESEPSWLDGEVKEKIISESKVLLERIIVKDTRKILYGGVWILAGKAKVGYGINCRIISLHDSSQVGKLYGSSKVGILYGSSQVGILYDSSQVLNDKRIKT